MFYASMKQSSVSFSMDTFRPVVAAVWHNGIGPLSVPLWGIYWSFCALKM
jgi:hypothetical protein